MKNSLFGIGVLFAIFTYSGTALAQTNVPEAVTDFVGGIIEDKLQDDIDEATGAAEVKGAIPTSFGEALGMFVGDIPSPVMGQLVKEMRIKFLDPYTNKPSTYGGIKNSVCNRAANSRAWEALQQIEQKAHFGPWIDIAWNTITSIAGGGATIGELIKDNTKAELEKLIKDAINTNPPKPEVKTLYFESNCNLKSVTTVDLANNKITTVITGNCDCEWQTVGLSHERLKDFEVRIEAKIYSKVQLKKSPLFWRDPQPQVQYGIGNIKVTTKANCSCKIPDDLVDPPEEEKGFIAGIIDWFTGFFDSSEPEQEDGIDEPEDDTVIKKQEDASDTSEEDLTESLSVAGLFGETVDEPEYEAGKIAEPIKKEVIKEEEKEVVIVKKEAFTGTTCESAIRFVLKEYVNYPNPNLKISASEVTSIHGPHTCIGDDNFDRQRRKPLKRGVSAIQVKAACPYLSLVSAEEVHFNGEGEKALCDTELIFAF